MREIGDAFGVSWQAVQGMLKRAGVDPRIGGRAIRRAFQNWPRKSASAYNGNYGCTFVQARELSSNKERSAFHRQRMNAFRRGIPWDLTLIQWLLIWGESGKSALRGRFRDSFVMARKGDAGAYSAENVYITTASQNARDYQLVTRPARMACSTSA